MLIAVDRKNVAITLDRGLWDKVRKAADRNGLKIYAFVEAALRAALKEAK